VSDVAKLSIAVLQRVSEFLATLPEEQITDIAEGRATLTYHPFGTATPVAPKKAPARRTSAKPTADMAQAVAGLGRMQSREEGEGYLKPMTVGDLRAVAAQLGIRGVSKTSKMDLIAMLVERTIGSRLNSLAVRRL
jgi:hypothetical protein